MRCSMLCQTFIFITERYEQCIKVLQYCYNDVIISKKMKQKLIKQMPPDIKHAILDNMKVKLYLMTTYVSQGSAATDFGEVKVLIQT